MYDQTCTNFEYFILKPGIILLPTLRETNSLHPKMGWLEYDRFLLGPGQFSGALAVY